MDTTALLTRRITQIMSVVDGNLTPTNESSLDERDHPLPTVLQPIGQIPPSRNECSAPQRRSGRVHVEDDRGIKAVISPRASDVSRCRRVRGIPVSGVSTSAGRSMRKWDWSRSSR